MFDRRAGARWSRIGSLAALAPSLETGGKSVQPAAFFLGRGVEQAA